MSKETNVSAITIHSTDQVRIVRIPSESCIDIRINDLRVTVFYPEDDQVPEVLLQTEAEASHHERQQQLKAAIGIPFRKPASRSHDGRE